VGKAWKNFSKETICGKNATCTHTSQSDAESKYAVGPVYIACASDWRLIAEKWWEFVPKVYKEYPFLLAEMYALTMAVADLSIPFTLVSNYMVSDPKTRSPTEAWSWVDDLAIGNAGGSTSGSVVDAVCAGANITQLPTFSGHRNRFPFPTTLHYCQRYSSTKNFGDGHTFAKRRIPHDFFKCDGDFLDFDPALVVSESGGSEASSAAVREAFMLCHLIPVVNLALKNYKQDMCHTQ